MSWAPWQGLYGCACGEVFGLDEDDEVDEYGTVDGTHYTVVACPACLVTTRFEQFHPFDVLAEAALDAYRNGRTTSIDDLDEELGG